MTLFNLIHTIKHIALNQPNVRTFIEGDIYENLNSNPSVNYNCICLTQSNHTTNGDFSQFGFNIFFVGRLVDDMEDNRLQTQSIGIEVINNILKVLEEVYDIEYSNPTFTTFTERFADECAGVYCSVTLITEKEIYCAEGY